MGLINSSNYCWNTLLTMLLTSSMPGKKQNKLFVRKILKTRCRLTDFVDSTDIHALFLEHLFVLLNTTQSLTKQNEHKRPLFFSLPQSGLCKVEQSKSPPFCLISPFHFVLFYQQHRKSWILHFISPLIDGSAALVCKFITKSFG